MTAASQEENPDPDRVLLPSGQLLTPLAAPGAQQQYLSADCQPQSVAGGAMATVVSPDGKTMLVLDQWLYYWQISTTHLCLRYIGTVVTQRYTTVNLLRTIEDILGLQQLGIYTAMQTPMTEVSIFLSANGRTTQQSTGLAN